MPDATVAASPAAGFARADLTTFCRLDELGLEVTGQRLEPGRAVLACRVLEPGQWRRRCGCEGLARDTVIRQLAREPPGWRPPRWRSRSVVTGVPVFARVAPGATPDAAASTRP